MRIAVIGAAGKLGRVVVVEAARRGHEVTGLARSSDLANVTGLSRAVVGDARDAHVVEQAIDAADAVVCTVTGGTGKDPHQARDVATTLTAAMARSGVSRLVVTSAYPIVAERPMMVMAVLRRIFATPFADTAAADATVAASGLDWTIVRLNRLTDRPPVGSAHVAEGVLDRATGLTRADAATLLVNLAESRQHTGRAVNVRGHEPEDVAIPRHHRLR